MASKQKQRSDTGPTVMLRAPAVVARVGLCRRSIDRLVAQGKFPAPRRLSAQAVAWVEREVEEFLSTRERVKPSEAA